MKRIDWCRENAPTALQSLSNSELLAYMSSAADNSGVQFDVDDLSYLAKASVKEQLDYIFARIAERFNDTAVFKGGYVLSHIVGQGSRSTHDIDVDMINGIMANALVDDLESLGKELKQAGVISAYRSKGVPGEDRCGGYDYKRLDGIVIGVDIGAEFTSDLIMKRHIEGITVNGYDLEVHVADKLTAILGDRVLRRTKDLYDLYVLSGIESIDYSIVAKEIDSFLLLNWPLSDSTISKVRHGYDKLIINRYSSDKRVDNPDFDLVLESIDVMIIKVRENL